MPLTNMNNLTVLGDDIYVYKNFLSKEECDYIYGLLESSEKESWGKMWGDVDESISPKISPEMIVSELIISRLSDLSNKYEVKQNRLFTKMVKGNSWGEHSDNAMYQEIRKKSNLLKDGDDFKIIHNTAYGVVVYINDNYKGGEIFYSKQNIVYKPKAGDLVIHSSEEKCEHGVKVMIEGSRYAWSSNLGNSIRIPVEK